MKVRLTATEAEILAECDDLGLRVAEMQGGGSAWALRHRPTGRLGYGTTKTKALREVVAQLTPDEVGR